MNVRTNICCCLVIVLTGLLTNGCTTPDSTTPTITLENSVKPSQIPSPSLTNTPKLEPGVAASITTSPVPMLPPTHRIGIRKMDGIGEFFDRQTGEKFIPRGFNYVRLAPMSTRNSSLWHSTLNPGFYDPERADKALQELHALGYNVVRIFVDCCREGNNVGDPRGGISTAYLDNIIDFINKAKENNIYVLLIFDLTPAQGGYDELWQNCCEIFDGENLRYLSPGGHRSEARFNRELIQAFIKHGAPMDAILAYDLTNEVHFSVDKAPFNWTEGKVTTANKQTYDMALESDKIRMMDENLVFWIDQQRASILEIDPTALVTVSFPAVNAGQTTVHTGPAIWESTADFIDLHAYLGWGLTLEEYVNRFEINGHTEKPIILGEFGLTRRSFPSVEMAASALQQMQVDSCKFGFDGWLMWTWDTEEQNELWNANSNSGVISTALSPKKRPDPCSLIETSSQPTFED